MAIAGSTPCALPTAPGRPRPAVGPAMRDATASPGVLRKTGCVAPRGTTAFAGVPAPTGSRDLPAPIAYGRGAVEIGSKGERGTISSSPRVAAIGSTAVVGGTR